MRALQLISTTAAIVLLGACAVSAQGIKTDATPGVPAAQQSAPPEKMAPAGKSDQIKVPEKTGQAATSQSDTQQQTTDRGTPASVATKSSSNADSSPVVKSKRAERHVGARYARGYNGPLYDVYRGDHGYRDCRGHRHDLMPWQWC
jgi:hypothetical protein